MRFTAVPHPLAPGDHTPVYQNLRSNTISPKGWTAENAELHITASEAKLPKHKIPAIQIAGVLFPSIDREQETSASLKHYTSIAGFGNYFA